MDALWAKTTWCRADHHARARIQRPCGAGNKRLNFIYVSEASLQLLWYYLLPGCRFFHHQSQGRTLRKCSQGKGRQLARRTWRCMRGSRKSSVRRVDAMRILMLSCTTEMYIVHDFDCSWKLDPQDCKHGSLNCDYLQQLFHGGLSMILCCQLVLFLHTLCNF